MKPTTTRTLGPLHLEDLEPHRFEDLVRQLAYDFRDWERLEATGRAGSDDGFDARGIERLSADADADDEDEAGRTSPPGETRQWVIQCKREKAIGPAKIVENVDALPDEDVYGVIFAAACEFSKKARDAFLDRCRERGFREVLLWGKAEIEDQLFQPRNDHLLFAYFGISLRTRRRSAQAELRAVIATKRRLKKLLADGRSWMVVVRDAAASTYPKDPGFPSGRTPSWFVAPACRVLHRGLEVQFRAFKAYLADDGLGWDAADVRDLFRRYWYVGRWPIDGQSDPREQNVDQLWDGWPEVNRAWLYVKGLIPFERILAVDDSGDEYFDGPQIFVEYDKVGPFSAYLVYVEDIQMYAKRQAAADPGTRVQVFPKELRRT